MASGNAIMHGKKKIALVIGRFQPFHLGHLKAVRKILGENRKLILAFGSAQASRTETNPFSVQERIEMVSECLRSEGMLEKVAIRKLDDENHHERWVAKVKKIASGATVLYSGNKLVRSLLKGKFAAKNMTSDVKISGTQIRRMIRRNEGGWKKYVPREVIRYLERRKLLRFV